MSQRGIVWITLLPYIIGTVAFVGLAIWAYQYVDNNWATDAGVKKGKAEIQVKWDAAIAAQRAIEETKISDATTKKESADEKAKVIYKTITRTVDRYIDRPIYRQQCLDPDGLRDANSALRGPSATTGKPDKPVPAALGAPGRDGSSGAAKADRGK